VNDLKKICDFARANLAHFKAPKVTAAYDAKWGGSFINGDFFTRLVYKGLTDYANNVDGLTTIPSRFGPKKMMERLETEIQAKGMMVFARIDHAVGAAEVGRALLTHHQMRKQARDDDSRSFLQQYPIQNSTLRHSETRFEVIPMTTTLTRQCSIHLR